MTQMLPVDNTEETEFWDRIQRSLNCIRNEVDSRLPPGDIIRLNIPQHYTINNLLFLLSVALDTIETIRQNERI